MRRTTPISIFACIACVAFVSPLAAQSDGDGYRKLVDDYRRYGASAVPRAEALTDEQIAAGRQGISGSWEEQRAAAMLHTEAVLSLANKEELPAATRQLNVAVALLDDVMKAAPAQQDFGYRWYALIERLLRQFRASATANELRKKAKDRFSEEFLVNRSRFDDAVVFEWQGCRLGSPPSARRLGTTMEADPQSRYWFSAVTLFQKVLDADPEFLAAALHIGRLHMLDGRLDEATSHFERALAALDPRVKYLAHLFLGSLDERAGRMERAEQHYRDAMGGYPWGQAAHLALAQLLGRTGRDAEGRTLLIARFDKPEERIIEPLWTYVIQPNEELPARFDELRAEVWK
jgi:tetratricopeptide (TPR) repeat protein